MQVSDLFRFKNREIKALHLTGIAFFITFYVWFNMAPLASSTSRASDCGRIRPIPTRGTIRS